jgi:two-component system sensor histidine kinase BaeS
MMSQRHCGRRPRWWPENEPWPPQGDQAHQWSRAGRVRFFRRIAIVGFLLLVFGVCGIVALLWLVFERAGIIAGAPRAAALVLIAVALVAGAFVIALLRGMRRVGVPLRGVMEAADQVAEGNYAIRVEERGPPPIRALARSFNTMTERLGNHDRLRRDMMADIAHELRTPLAVIQGKLEGLLDGVYQRDDAQLTELLGEVHVLVRLVEDLRTLALSESGALKLEKEPTDIIELVHDVAQAFQRQAAVGNVKLRVECATDLPPIAIDAVRIREVLVNLVTNALQHTPPGGTIDIRVAETNKTAVSVDVSDNGTGMTVEEAHRAFERFHKGSESRGFGLGLAIGRNLVVAHGGEIQLTSAPGRGTKIRFTLPRNRAE